MFRDSLFSLNQFDILVNSLLINNSSAMGSLCEKIIFVSSAKIIKWEVSEHLGRSLIYKRNKRGPRIDPCGTPQVILEDAEC